MPVYLIANVKVTDDAWVHDIVKRHGGGYLSRSGNIRTIEGEAPDTTLIGSVEFPTFEAVQAFANDPDYKPHGEARKAGSVSNFHVIDDTDLAGSIPYLRKGG